MVTTILSVIGWILIAFSYTSKKFVKNEDLRFTLNIISASIAFGIFTSILAISIGKLF